MPSRVVEERPVTNGAIGVHRGANPNIRGGNVESQSRCLKPIAYTGSLDCYRSTDLTPVIGREFEGLQVVALLEHPERARFIKDLAATISQRGVVFLRNQDVKPHQMRELCEILTEAGGCPESSGLHLHPLTEEGSELGDQISVISSDKQKRGGGLTHQLSDTSRYASVGWHADITFEPVPSDYAMLKIHTLPPTGGDTLWASGYEIFDRLSPAMQNFLESLTATHDAKFFLEEAERLGNPLRKGVRGSPLNHGESLEAIHPVIRTNPVTGWKSLFVNKGFTKRINGVTKDESDMLLNYLFNLVTQNHDVQVRFKWNKNDLAIWDNRSTWHCATFDYVQTRAGDRVCSLGEAPYLDVNSKSRRDAIDEARSKTELLARTV
jgi:alpha-ketoglutarate-dependent taurine dioxygenase